MQTVKLLPIIPLPLRLVIHDALFLTAELAHARHKEEVDVGILGFDRLKKLFEYQTAIFGTRHLVGDGIEDRLVIFVNKDNDGLVGSRFLNQFGLHRLNDAIILQDNSIFMSNFPNLVHQHFACAGLP